MSFGAQQSAIASEASPSFIPTMALKTTALALVFLPLAASFAQAADPVGTWLVAGQDAIVRIADCASLQASADQSAPPVRTLCGTVVWLKEPIDPATGKPPVDSKNVDPAKNRQPVLGMPGVFHMHPAREPDQWDAPPGCLPAGRMGSGNPGRPRRSRPRPRSPLRPGRAD